MSTLEMLPKTTSEKSVEILLLNAFAAQSYQIIPAFLANNSVVAESPDPSEENPGTEQPSEPADERDRR
jgi:hypothetical protein